MYPCGYGKKSASKNTKLHINSKALSYEKNLHTFLLVILTIKVPEPVEGP